MLKRCWAMLLIVILIPAMASAGDPTLCITPDPKIDINMNRIADSLEDSVADLAAKNLSGEELDVVITLYNTPNSEDGNLFRNHGGVITHRYSHALYGYAGKIPADRIAGLAQDWGAKLCLIEIDAPLTLMMDSAVPQTRVRPYVWNTFGLTGNPDITIGIIDTGLDMTHPDLQAKLEFWHDFHPEQEPRAIDRIGHGTAVAGLAVGTGARYGSEPLSSLELTFSKLASNSGVSFPLGIPFSGDKIVSTDIFWQGADGWGGVLGQACVEFGSANLVPQGPRCSKTSPFREQWNLDVPGMQRFWVGFSNGSENNIFAMRINFPYQQRDDGFNLMTGMAPGCRLAGAKICAETGSISGCVSAYVAACDSFAAINSQINLKVANVSMGLYVDNLAMRYASNGLVSAGTVMTVAAGNGYPLSLGDPAKAPMVITVGAVDDFGLLTNYSSNGHLGVDKPDVLAPGGCFIEDNYSVGLPVYLCDSNCSDGGLYSNCFPDACPDDYNCGGTGTSISSPLVAGLAALIIEALESQNHVWNYTLEDALLVKSIILMTATETNLPRNADVGGNPILNRGGRDLYEGYGMINADAAIESVLKIWPLNSNHSVSITFGDDPADRRCWAASLNPGVGTLNLHLALPPTLDADIYIYSPDLYTDGDPILLASSINPNAGDDEYLTITPAPGVDFYITVKRISGFGEAILYQMGAPMEKSMTQITRLNGNFPNPFNPQTTIQFNVGQQERVTVAVYDVAGRQVALLEDRVFEAGPQEVVWNGDDLQGKAVASGTYFVLLKTQDKEEQQKIMLVR